MSAAIKARRWVLQTRPEGLPKPSDFKIVEELEFPPLKDGEFITEAIWLSVDPYIRYELVKLEIGETIVGIQVGKVIQSKSGKFSVGDLVVGEDGWRTHCLYNDGESDRLFKLDPSIQLSPSTALGVLGMPGATAYFGLLEVCDPLKEGETLVVNAAAGAVGSLVGQIGKIKGMRVVGFAGSDDKVAYLKSLGFDAAYNYKTVSSLADAVKEGCPNGVDVFFDNVGGEFFDTVLAQMNTDGRVSICGCISQYNLTEIPKAQPVSGLILTKQLMVRGFIVRRWLPRWNEAFEVLGKWIAEGKLTYKEHVVEGFDNMPDAFIGLFRGVNIGKVVVKA